MNWKKFEIETIDRLGRIETKLDLIMEQLSGGVEPGLLRKYETLEKRLQGLESHRIAEKHQFQRIAAVIGFLLNCGIAIGGWFY